MNIIDKLNKNSKKDVYDCRIISLREVFKYYNISDSGYVINILAKCINFLWMEFEYKTIKFPVCGVSNFFVEEEIAKSCGFSVSKKKLSNAEDLWETTKTNVDNNKPFVVLFDSQVFRDLEEGVNIKKNKGILDFSYASAGVVIGYDNDKQEIIFLGNIENDMFGIRRNKVEELYTAMDNSESFIDSKNTIYSFDIDDKKSEEVRKNLRDLILKSLKNTCERMLFDKIEVYYGNNIKGNGVAGINSFSQYIGNLAEEIKEIEEVKGSITAKKLTYLKMFVFREAILKGTITCFRGEFSESLAYVKDNFDMPYLEAAENNFDKLAGKYRKLVRSLSSILRVEEKFYLKLKEIADLLNEIYILEKQAFEELEDEIIKNEKVDI